MAFVQVGAGTAGGEMAEMGWMALVEDFRHIDPWRFYVITGQGLAAILDWAVMGMLCGAAVFSCVNWILSRWGAQHRKRCGECLEQPK